MAATPRILTYKGTPVWRHSQVIQWALQTVSGVLVVVLVVWFFANINNAIRERNIPYGFSFLEREYQAPIGQSFLSYESAGTYLYALEVAATNTIVISIVGVILATALGTVVGVARMSGNWIVSRMALAYVEFFRNVPLLVQLFFWFYAMLALPRVSEGYVFAQKVYVNNSGVSLPWPQATSFEAAASWLAVAAAGVIAGVAVHRLLTRRETLAGPSYPLVTACVAAVVVGAAGWLIIDAVTGAAPFAISDPAPHGAFERIKGGYTIWTELIVLLAGLVIYTSAFIAEIVRAGIQSVGRGQSEAARSLGLTPMSTLRHVIFPQALRVIVPPLISQYLNLTKNSSLAAAIGYLDLTNVAKTMTQTEPVVSLFVLIMLAYLAMSLTYSLIGNLYNRHIRFRGS